MYEYRVYVKRVIDGDTVDVDVDLGFGVVLKDERIRLEGIDTPESRTSDRVEKLFGIAAKRKVEQLLISGDCILVSKTYDSRGKFGRILGDIVVVHGESRLSVCETLIKERFAVAYHGQSKDDIEAAHIKNRAVLLENGVIDFDAYNDMVIAEANE